MAIFITDNVTEFPWNPRPFKLVEITPENAVIGDGFEVLTFSSEGTRYRGRIFRSPKGWCYAPEILAGKIINISGSKVKGWMNSPKFAFTHIGNYRFEES